MVSARSIAGVFSFPLAFAHTCPGPLTLYRWTPGQLTDGQRDAASTAATAAALTVAAHLLAEQATHDAQCGLHKVDRLHLDVERHRKADGIDHRAVGCRSDGRSDGRRDARSDRRGEVSGARLMCAGP